MIINGNALHIPLADGTVQTCVTSPPYYGLRDYGTAAWDGGDPECDHKPTSTNRGKRKELPNPPAGWAERSEYEAFHKVCGKCGAVRVDDQIGLEETPEEYIEKMVAVFREVRRVLRDDGTIWINMGDAYASTPSGSFGKGNNGRGMQGGEFRANKPFSTVGAGGAKAKDLLGIPWMLAFALRSDGWYLRSDIIWAKPNPMPESVRDRPTKAHEYIFLLSKQARYYYDADAIREEWTSGRDDMRSHGIRTGEAYIQQGKIMDNSDKGERKAERNQHNYTGGRNKRSVWEVATKPYSGAHFATFPPDLIEPCILAGTSEKGGCPECGAPWERVVEASGGTIGKGWTDHKADLTKGMSQANYMRVGSQVDKNGELYKRTTTGWRPTCDCNAGDPVPQVVLDPFSGSGTTGEVAIQHRRKYFGIELNMEYIALSRERMTTDVMLPMMAVTR